MRRIIEILPGTLNYALSYLAIISLLAVYLSIRDKRAAQKNTRRVKERTLLVVSALGGSAAMLVTMLAIRYKTLHIEFMVGIPLILLEFPRKLLRLIDRKSWNP